MGSAFIILPWLSYNQKLKNIARWTQCFRIATHFPSSGCVPPKITSILFTYSFDTQAGGKKRGVGKVTGGLLTVVKLKVTFGGIFLWVSDSNLCRYLYDYQKVSRCFRGWASAVDPGSIPGSVTPLWGRHGSPLQYSCLENPMDRGAWRAAVPGVAKSQTRLTVCVGRGQRSCSHIFP